MGSKLESRVWGFLSALVSLIPFYFFEFDPLNSDLRYPPFPSGGDSIAVRLLIRSIRDGDTIPFFGMNFERMGAPLDPVSFSASFPIPEQLQLLVLKFFSVFVNDPGRIQNLYYLSGYVLSSIAFYLSARWLKIRPAIAFGLSVAFTYLTYHYTRFDHIFLSQYWPLAPATALLVKVARKELGQTRREGLLAFGASLFVTAWHSYYGYFFCGLYAITWLYANRQFSKKAAFQLMLPILGFLLAIGVSTAHSFVARSQSTDLPPAFKRWPIETLYYGLRPTSLLLPVPHHRIPIFAELRDRYLASEGRMEGTNEGLGTLGLVGLILGVGAWVLGFRRKGPLGEIDSYGFLQILAIFFSCSIGIAVWVSYTITPVFRSVNRISPFIAAASLFAVGTVLSRAITRWDRKRFGKIYGACVGIALAVFAVWDQVPAVQFDPNAAREQQIAERFVSAIDTKVGTGAVLQLPNIAFPEGGPNYWMADYSHSVGPYFAKLARFSYGPARGTRHFAELQFLAEHPTDIETIRKHGYVAIWIDRYGYADHGVAIERELLKILPQKPLISEDGRRSFFMLSR